MKGQDAMKKTKIFATIFLSIILVLGLTGCGKNNVKDNIIDGYEQCLKQVSKYALTKKGKLQGKKTKGEDSYVGSYTAQYDSFDGEECIFGGTALNREAGNELIVTYTLKVTSGTVSLFWQHSGSEYTIADEESEGSFEITLAAGDDYINLRGEDFSGSLELEVK